MPVLINGELLSKELIREEAQRLGQAPDWLSVPDSPEKRIRLQQAAEQFAIDRVLLRQVAEKDTRPLDPQLADAEVQRFETGKLLLFVSTCENSSLMRPAAQASGTSHGEVPGWEPALASEPLREAMRQRAWR
jgi:hypothetical protein